MNFRYTTEDIKRERLRVYNERMNFLAQAHHCLQEAERLLREETDLMRMYDNMQIRARYQQGTEARQ